MRSSCAWQHNKNKSFCRPEILRESGDDRHVNSKLLSFPHFEPLMDTKWTIDQQFFNFYRWSSKENIGDVWFSARQHIKSFGALKNNPNFGFSGPSNTREDEEVGSSKVDELLSPTSSSLLQINCFIIKSVAGIWFFAINRWKKNRKIFSSNNFIFPEALYSICSFPIHIQCDLLVREK